MVRKNGVALLAGLAGSVVASPTEVVPWQPAAETPVAEQDHQALKAVSPKVTGSPIPPFGQMEDLRRDFSVSANTCGFFTSGLSALSCSPGETCTNSGHIRDCCVGAGCSTSVFSTACLDATAPACSGTAGPPPGTICCNNDVRFGYCVTFLWATSTDTSNVYTLYNCDVQQFAGTEILLATPTGSITASTSSTSSTSSTTTSFSSSSESSTTVTSSSTASAAPSSGGGTPVGPIVGGVVGGVAVIGLAVLLIVFLIFRRRKRAAADQAAFLPPQPQPQPSPQPPPGMPDMMQQQQPQHPPSVYYQKSPITQPGSPAPTNYDPRYSYIPPTSTSPSVGGMPSPNQGSPPHLSPSGYTQGSYVSYDTANQGQQPMAHYPHGSEQHGNPNEVAELG